MNFEFDLQLFGGKGGSATNVQSYQPTAQEIRLQKQAADYSEAVAPNALDLNNKAKGLLENSLGETQVDYNALNKQAQSQISGAQGLLGQLTNGQLPETYQKNMQDSINRAVTGSVGTAVNSLGNRGILNSSVTNQALNDVSTSAANAAADKYLENISTLNGLAGQQAALAGQGITTAAGAQEAAQQPALNLWNASLGLNSGGTLGALQSMAGQGTTTSTQNWSNGSGNMFGGIMTGLAGNSSLFCFTEDTLIKTPKEDVKISHLAIGDEVICPNDDGTETIEKINDVMDPVYSEVYTVVARSGQKTHYVNTTLSETLRAEDGKFILVGDLKVGQKLANVGAVTAIIYSGERKVYDITITGENKFYANGFIAEGM